MISPITYVQGKPQVELLSQLGIKEAIIETSRLSRHSKLSLEECLEIQQECLRCGIRPVLQWDILMTENAFQSSKNFIEKCDLTCFSAIRVRDPGAIHYIFTHYPEMKIQLILENGNHNLESLLIWEKTYGSRIDRLILSVEISKSQLKDYKKILKSKIEVLGVGRMPLFYSPRALLSHAFNDDEIDRDISVVASSEESPHRGFDIEENIHGTTMFNPKDYGPLMHWKELDDMGIDFLRFDFRHISDAKFQINLIEKSLEILISVPDQLKIKIEEFKDVYQRPLIKGFYPINKTNVLFKKLKNSRTARSDKNYIGEIIEVNKGIHLGVLLKARPLRMDDQLILITPDGKKKEMIIKKLENSNLDHITESPKGEIVFIKHLGGVSVKTQVYLKDKSEL